MKLNKKAFALALMACVVSPLAHAMVTYEVQPGTNPNVLLDNDQKILLYVPGKADSNLQLNVPDMGISQAIEPDKQNTFFLNAKNVPEPQFTYSVQTPDGQVIASGVIVTNNPSTVSDADLNKIMNYSTAYSYEQKPAPRYGSSVAQAESSEDMTSGKSQPQYIRGTW